jgi:hypothetical protein
MMISAKPKINLDLFAPHKTKKVFASSGLELTITANVQG